MLKARDDRGEDAIDGCFCCCFLIPIQKEFHRNPDESGSSNWFYGWESELTQTRDEWNLTHRASRRLHIDNKCCNHETMPQTACPCICAVKIIPF